MSLFNSPASRLSFSANYPPSSGSNLNCETSTEILSPLVPEKMKRSVFGANHNISHPGKGASRRLVSRSFFLVRSLQGCQTIVSVLSKFKPISSLILNKFRFLVEGFHIFSWICSNLNPPVICNFLPSLIGQETARSNSSPVYNSRGMC